MATTHDYEADGRKADALCIDARDVRAIEQEITVCEHIGLARGADGLFLVVSESGSEYLVDVFEGTCECPDNTHNGNHCKHLRRVTFETGMRPLEARVLAALDVSSQLDGEHVDGEPTVVPPQSALEMAADADTQAVATDGGHERPADCSCVAPSERDDGRTLPCFPCYNAGFRSVNPEVLEADA